MIDAAANPVLEKILATQTVSDGLSSYPLHSHVDPFDGGLLQRAVEAVRPAASLEIGMAYGISTLFICDALARLNTPSRHVVIDPFQRSDWRGVGLRNVRDAGYEKLVEFHEERSEYLPPRFATEGREFDLALVDGWHSFDQVLVEFYYLNRLLRVGGIIVFDDADWPGLNKALRYIVTYPTYKVFQPPVQRPSLLGRWRRRLAARPCMEAILSPKFQHRTWDLGLTGRCVAIQKVAPDQREMTWHREF